MERGFLITWTSNFANIIKNRVIKQMVEFTIPDIQFDQEIELLVIRTRSQTNLLPDRQVSNVCRVPVGNRARTTQSQIPWLPPDLLGPGMGNYLWVVSLWVRFDHWGFEDYPLAHRVGVWQLIEWLNSWKLNWIMRWSVTYYIYPSYSGIYPAAASLQEEDKVTPFQNEWRICFETPLCSGSLFGRRKAP